MKRAVVPLLALAALAAAPAEAGHELSFYPSYYPQEIRIERHAPAAAAALLAKSALHAYVGADPFGERPAPGHVRAVESLGAYLVLTLGPTSPLWTDARGRCEAARAVATTLAGSRGPFVVHPYPVTPYHADYLAHFDRAEAAKARYLRHPAGPLLRLPGLGAVGSRAEALVRAHWSLAAAGWPVALAATLEEVDVEALVAPHATAVNGWLGPPWLKAGWFHAYLLQRPGIMDEAARQAVDALYRRLTTGRYDGATERLELERELVARLGAGCERVVLGYATRRERYSAEFSDGVENVAADAQAGLGAPIFARTVKLKDFPWNGWLKLGVPDPAAAAWNPIAGFTDPTGRLVWAALGDPAFFAAPQGATWVGNRVTAMVTTRPAGRIDVPKDARLPDEQGRWREVGPGHSARTRIVYRVLASAFHDGSRMTVADTLHGLAFAYRWGVPGGASHDPAVEAGTARLRDWLAGVRLLRVDPIEREFGEVKFTSSIQTLEVYGRHALDDPEQTASVTAPWSAVPWPLLVLMEEAVRRGVAAFSAAEARRLGRPWLDLARDAKQRERLGALLDELAGRAAMPAALARHVTPAEARDRWAALRRFYEKHGHLLVTNGPYRLASWTDDAVVLDVFRDFSYPLGVGSYDRYAIPLRRGYVAKAETHGDRLEVHADVDVVQKFQRDYAVAREPLRAQPAALDARDLPVCRYVVLDARGRVAAAGAAPYAGSGVYAVDLRALPRGGRHTVLVALYVRDNAVDAEVRAVPVERP